jgi:hypothetical protein
MGLHLDVFFEFVFLLSNCNQLANALQFSDHSGMFFGFLFDLLVWSKQLEMQGFFLLNFVVDFDWLLVCTTDLIIQLQW